MPSSVLGKKKLRQTQIQVRKSGQQQPAPKRTRFTFLGPNEQLIFFKIPPTIEASSSSPRIPNDCVVCSLLFLKIITSREATELRLRMIQRTAGYGISIADIITLLTSKMGKKYSNVDFRTIPNSKGYLLFEAIPPQHAFVVGLHPKDRHQPIGHMVVLFKDHNGKLGLIDPQNDQMCYSDQCMNYLSRFSQESLTVFVGKPI